MESKAASFFKELISFAVIALVIVIPIRMFVAQPFVVSGESMYPTFETGEYLIVDQISYKIHTPERGDVIIFRYPNNPSKFFIKRVVGLPGETIRIEDSEVFITDINGDTKKLEEPYIEMDRNINLVQEIGDTAYFVMGDNRIASLDSRVWGPLEENLIIGKAFIRLLPTNKIDLLPGDYSI